MKESFYISEFKQKGSIWRIPVKLLEKYSLAEGATVTLSYGTFSTEVSVYRISPKEGKKPSTISFSSTAMKKLKVIDGSSVLLKQEGKNKFRIGPVIGILTFSKILPDRVNYYSVYARRVGANGLVYVFCSKGLSRETATIKGYYYDWREDIWKTGQFPYPDVVINRCYPNPVKTCEILEEKMGRNKIFNRKTLINKLDFYQSLKHIKELKAFLPKTRLLTHKEDLIGMLSENDEVFLKPLDGMMGRGIVKVKKLRIGKALECMYLKKEEKKFVRQICHINKIPKVLMEASGRKRSYVVQQAIQRMHYEDGPFSFRTWAMKNSHGKWVMPGMFAKVSYGDNFLTNFTAGAKLISVNKLIQYLEGRISYTREELLNLLETLTINTAKALDEKYGPLGELGMDIVFDQKGKPWLIEANGNPGNIPIFIQKDYPLWKDLVFRYPVEYAAYLAGFGQRKSLKK